MVSNVGIGGWKVASGEWGVGSGEWRVASSEWGVGSGGGVIASGSEAIQLVVQEEVSRLGGGRDVAGFSWIASRSLFKTIHRIVLPPFGGHASPR